MEIVLENICKGISRALEKGGLKSTFYRVEGNKAEIVSGSVELYEIIQKEEESRTIFDIECKQGTISDAVYDYFDRLSGYNSMNFPSGAKQIVVRVDKTNEQKTNETHNP